MNRRAFLKIALVASGVAIGTYFGQVLDATNTSLQSLENQTQFGATTFTTDDWKISHLLRRMMMEAGLDAMTASHIVRSRLELPKLSYLRHERFLE